MRLGIERQTLRNRQLAPSPDLMESIYAEISNAGLKVSDAKLETDDAWHLAGAIKDLAGAVTLLADLVDRETVRPTET